MHPDFVDVYNEYKKKTNKAVTWLRMASQSNATSVQSMLSAAEKVVREGLDVPQDILWNLSDAIKARIEISSYYKKRRSVMSPHAISSDTTHAHFISMWDIVPPNSRFTELIFHLVPSQATEDFHHTQLRSGSETDPQEEGDVHSIPLSTKQGNSRAFNEH